MGPISNDAAAETKTAEPIRVGAGLLPSRPVPTLPLYGRGGSRMNMNDSVLDESLDEQMERNAAAMFDEDVSINWWRAIGWTVAIGGCLVFWYQVLALFDWW